MNNLSSSQRSYLKSKAHHLKPHICIGKNGISDGVLHSLNNALDKHELIKVKFLAFKDSKSDIAKHISEQTNSIILGIVGNILIIFRENSDPDKRQYKY